MNIFPKIFGAVDNWDIIVIGHLKVNTYFGESYDAPPRGDPSTCTSVMICGKQAGGKPYVLIVDPTLRLRPEDYYFDVNRRTGLSPASVTHCFVTHHHLDHYEALSYFPNAEWIAAPPVAKTLHGEGNKDKVDVARIADASGEFLPGVHALPLPGHTSALHGLAFAHEGKKIIVAADAVMSKYHFQHETTDFQPDPNMKRVAAETIRNMKESFDIVIPGHDNLIVV